MCEQRPALRILSIILALTFLCALACPAYNLLIRVERRGHDDKKLLMEKGFAVSAEISGSLFVLCGDEELAVLTKYGFACEAVDRFRELSDYYLVGLRDDSDTGAVLEAGTVIYSEENLPLSRNRNSVAGGFHWYLVTAYNGAGEGTAGTGRTVNSTGACAL